MLPRVGSAALAVLLLVLVVRFATNGRGALVEAVGPDAPNQMALDAEPDVPGIQTSRVVVGGAPFKINLHITKDTDPFQAYDWGIGVEEGLAFTGTFVNVLTLDDCNIPQRLGDPLVTYYGGCRLSRTETTYEGLTTSIFIQCGRNGTFQVLLPDKVQSAFGASLLALGGALRDTGTAGISIECSGIPPGSTATPMHTPTSTPTPLPDAPNILAIDANPSEEGIQTNVDVSSAEPFTVDIHIKSLGSTPYEGLQWSIQFLTGGLAFDGNVINHGGDTGLNICVPPGVQNLPPYTRIGLGAGCISISSASTFVGRAVSTELRCVGEGSFDITLLSVADIGDFGSSLFRSGGAFIPTSTESATVNCFVSDPTVTATLTPTPTMVPPVACLTAGEKISLAAGIVRRLGAAAGDAAYKARYDVNDDGAIDTGDLELVGASPLCDPPRGQGRQ